MYHLEMDQERHANINISTTRAEKIVYMISFLVNVMIKSMYSGLSMLTSGWFGGLTCQSTRSAHDSASSEHACTLKLKSL